LFRVKILDKSPLPTATLCVPEGLMDRLLVLQGVSKRNIFGVTSELLLGILENTEPHIPHSYDHQ
jgi:hypothetical protein